MFGTNIYPTAQAASTAIAALGFNSLSDREQKHLESSTDNQVVVYHPKTDQMLMLRMQRLSFDRQTGRNITNGIRAVFA